MSEVHLDLFVVASSTNGVALSAARKCHRYSDPCPILCHVQASIL